MEIGEECIVEGSAVSGIDNCGIDAVCFNVDPATNHGTCVATCQGTENDHSCPNPDDTCSISHEGVPILCRPPCDPVAQDCADGLSCTYEGTQFVCVRPGPTPTGENCDGTFSLCDFGLTCGQPPTENCDDACCTEACDPLAPACPLPEQTCMPAGAYGLCVIE